MSNGQYDGTAFVEEKKMGMNLIDAIKSGKRFRQRGSAGPYIKAPHQSDDYLEYETGVALRVSLDILEDDWEVELEDVQDQINTLARKYNKLCLITYELRKANSLLKEEVEELICGKGPGG